MFSLFKNTNPDRHFRNVIKSGFNETNQDVLVIKASLEDFNTNSLIQVNANELAIFFQNGKIVQIFEPATTPVKTSNYPFFSNFMAILQGGVRKNTCSLYFVRTIRPKVPTPWGTPNTMEVRDPQYENMPASVGGSGVFSVKVDKEHLEKFFDECVGTGNASFTYDQLALMLSPSIGLKFLEHLRRLIDEYQYIDGLDPVQLTNILVPLMRDYLLNDFGLNMIEFAVGRIMVTNSPEREAIKKAIVEDSTERKRLLREAAQGALIREFEAKGKLKELSILGDNWMKMKIAELAETAMANPAIAQIGTSALGGFLGTHSDLFGQMVTGLVGTLGGNNGTQQPASSTAQSPTPDEVIDGFAPIPTPEPAPMPSDVAFAPAATNTPPATSTNEQQSKNEIVLKNLSELFMQGKISLEFYQQQIANLGNN